MSVSLTAQKNAQLASRITHLRTFFGAIEYAPMVRGKRIARYPAEKYDEIDVALAFLL